VTTRPIKVGMLGAGFILKSHANAVATLPAVKLQLVADASLARARAAADAYGFNDAADSIAAMAASDCDVVHILLPPALHLFAATAMVNAGKSVFLEKPMGLDSVECVALCDLATARGVSIGVNHNFLFAPHYETLRKRVKQGELGRIDHLAVNWHYGLPILQFGPFDNWMLGAPANLMFELGAHMAAFAIDLIGLPEIEIAQAGNPIALPNDRKTYRHWVAAGHAGSTAAQFSLSTISGQADRYLRVRGSGGSAQLDFGRDIGWCEITETDNPIFDAYRTARSIGSALSGLGQRDRIRRLTAALRKQPDSNPFEESVFRSIRVFYEGGVATVDPRHSGYLASDVIRLCESIAAKAGAGRPSRDAISIPALTAAKQPSVLVVGGTGFIGRLLVRKLVDAGVGVRVLTRNTRAAAIELKGLPIDLVEGSHGNPDSALEALKGIETVYHLAKCDGKRWQDYVDGDIEPTRTLAEAALQSGVQRFIYTGTIDSYASAKGAAVIDSLTPLDPSINRRNLYARSKAACEALLLAMHRDRGLPLVIVRPGIVIGPGSPPAHLGIGQFTSETQMHYWGDGTSKLPLVLADDVADALFRAMTVEDIEGQSFLLTGPPILTARDYVDAMSNHARTRIAASVRPAWRYWLADLVKEGAKIAIRHPNRRWPSLHDWRCRSHRARYDSDSAQNILGWKPESNRETLIRRGIDDAIDHFQR
jgi:predicted dehydrogenase/nucleoside-diphosphate-sugar epimerase